MPYSIQVIVFDIIVLWIFTAELWWLIYATSFWHIMTGLTFPRNYYIRSSCMYVIYKWRILFYDVDEGEINNQKENNIFHAKICNVNNTSSKVLIKRKAEHAQVKHKQYNYWESISVCTGNHVPTFWTSDEMQQSNVHRIFPSIQIIVILLKHSHRTQTIKSVCSCH